MERRIPPHNLDAEASVLGGVLLRNEAMNTIESLVPEDFYDPKHREVFAAMKGLEAKSRPIDPVTVEEQLAQSGKLTAVGGLAYLSDLVGIVPTADNIAHYATIVREKAAARRLILAASEICARGFGEYGEVREYLDEAERMIFEVTQHNERGGPAAVVEILKKVFKSFDARFSSAGGVTGIPSGFTDLDGMTAGMQPSDLIILAARPSMGKTSLAMSVAQNAAIAFGFPVIIFSLEMSSPQLAERMLCSEARIDASLLRRGQLQRQDMTNLTVAADAIAKAPMLIDDTPALTVNEVRARCRRWRSSRELFGDKPFGMIVVDYLQLMRGQNMHKNSNREQEISEISRGLKALAKELHCPVIALSQLNRGVEQRADKRPMLSDLRECVTGDTLVVLEGGQRRRIAELVGQTPRVMAVGEGDRLTAADSDKVWCVGKRPVHELRFISGRVLRATARHRLYTDVGWRRVAELTGGHRIGLARSPEPGASLVWESLDSITLGGHEDVFDLTVPGPASWLADGIVCHNSGAIEQDADVIMFIYRDEVYNKDKTEKQGVAEVIIGKQRNGPIGTVELRFEGRYTRFDNLARRGDEF
jgi:replicative DNA helicase